MGGGGTRLEQRDIYLTGKSISSDFSKMFFFVYPNVKAESFVRLNVCLSRGCGVGPYILRLRVLNNFDSDFFAKSIFKYYIYGESRSR